jgi:ribosomal protein L37AE/L43A
MEDQVYVCDNCGRAFFERESSECLSCHLEGCPHTFCSFECSAQYFQDFLLDEADKHVDEERER